jgi:hypothetical protein
MGEVRVPENLEVSSILLVTLPSQQFALLILLMVVNESVGYKWRKPQEYYLL